jgi:hypothetical protein
MFDPSEILNYGSSTVIKKLNVLQGDVRIHLKMTLSIIFIYFKKTHPTRYSAFQPQLIQGVRGHVGIGTLETLINCALFQIGNSTRLQASLSPQPDLRFVSSLILIINV